MNNGIPRRRQNATLCRSLNSCNVSPPLCFQSHSRLGGMATNWVLFGQDIIIWQVLSATDLFALTLGLHCCCIITGKLIGSGPESSTAM